MTDKLVREKMQYFAILTGTLLYRIALALKDTGERVNIQNLIWAGKTCLRISMKFPVK